MNFLGIVTALCCLAVSSAAFAGSKTKVSVLWQDFPSGTKCSASDVQGKLKTKKKRGHPVVEVRGFGEIGTYFCVLPDGRYVITDVNTRLPQGTRYAGITVYPDGRTFVTASTTAGLVSQQFANTLSFAK